MLIIRLLIVLFIFSPIAGFAIENSAIKNQTITPPPQTDKQPQESNKPQKFTQKFLPNIIKMISNLETNNTKQKESDWLNNLFGGIRITDIVVAIFTIVIGVYTWRLWTSTHGLLKESINQGRNNFRGIVANEKVADAADRSAKAIPASERAYLFVKVTMENPDAEAIAGTIDKEPQYNMGNVKIAVTNLGKTPALITGFPYTNEVMSDNTIDRYLPSYTSFTNTWMPPGVSIIESKEKIEDIPGDFLMNSDKWQEINIEKAFLTCLGCIHYEDIFGNRHKTSQTPNGINAHKKTERAIAFQLHREGITSPSRSD